MSKGRQLESTVSRRLRTSTVCQLFADTREHELLSMRSHLVAAVTALGAVEMAPDGAEIDTAALLRQVAACLEPLVALEELADRAAEAIGAVRGG